MKNHKTYSSRASEIRAIEDGEKGEFVGYPVKWGQVDSHGTKFVKGAFSDTLNKWPLQNVKVLYNHEDLVGSVISISEDDTGLLVRGRVNLNTEAGVNTWELLKAQDLNCLSFGFDIIKMRAAAGGIVEITEVTLFEVSPVAFPANPNANILSIRSKHMQNNGLKDKETEKRGADYSENLQESLRNMMPCRVLDAFEESVYALMWGVWDSVTQPEQAVAKLDENIVKFHADLLRVFSAYVGASPAEVYLQSDASVAQDGQDMMRSLYDYVKSAGDKPAHENMKALGETVKSLAEMLSRGEIGKQQRAAFADVKRARMEQLCSHLRSGLTGAEKTRVQALLGFTTEKRESELDKYIASIAN